MKKLILISVFLSSTFGYAQQEIKVDLFDLLVFKTFEISFEHYLNEESSIGLSALFNSGTNGDLNYNEKKCLRRILDSILILMFLGIFLVNYFLALIQGIKI